MQFYYKKSSSEKINCHSLNLMKKDFRLIAFKYGFNE